MVRIIWRKQTPASSTEFASGSQSEAARAGPGRRDLVETRRTQHYSTYIIHYSCSDCSCYRYARYTLLTWCYRSRSLVHYYVECCITTKRTALDCPLQSQSAILASAVTCLLSCLCSQTHQKQRNRIYISTPFPPAKPVTTSTTHTMTDHELSRDTKIMAPAPHNGTTQHPDSECAAFARAASGRNANVSCFVFYHMQFDNQSSCRDDSVCLQSYLNSLSSCSNTT